MWYPDSLAPHLAWKGSGTDADSGQHLNELAGGAFFNPFGSVPHLSRVFSFTEPLPPSAEQLQWAMPMPAQGEGQCMYGGAEGGGSQTDPKTCSVCIGWVLVGGPAHQACIEEAVANNRPCFYFCFCLTPIHLLNTNCNKAKLGSKELNGRLIRLDP